MEECTVCMEPLVGPDPVAVFFINGRRSCRHFFHDTCVSHLRQARCPVCSQGFNARSVLPPLAEDPRLWSTMMYRPDDNVSTSGDTVFGTSLLDVLKQHLPDVCVDQVESDLRARYVSVSFVEAVLGAVARKDNTLFSLFTAARPPPLRSYADFDKWWAYWAPFDRLSILEFDECARGSLQKEAGFVRHKHGARTVYRRADFTRSNWMELVLFEGCYVKLTIAQGARPALGWGELNPARPTPRVGCVRKKRTRTHHGRVVFKVEFPEQRAFHALADELSPASEVDVLSTRA